MSSRRNGRSSQRSDGRENVSRKSRTAARGRGETRFFQDEPGYARASCASVRSAAGVGRPAGRRRGRLVEQPLEDGIARVLGDPLAAQEREVGEVEVARAPAQHRGVEREDDRLAPAGLGAPDEALDQLVRGAPVELEPARRVAHRRRALLHRNRGLAREDHRHALGSGGARSEEVAAVARQLEHADRRQQERRRERAAEQLDAHVARRDVAEHARDDAPLVERLPVRPHRVLVAGAAGQIGEGLGRAGPCGHAPRAQPGRWALRAAGRGRRSGIPPPAALGPCRVGPARAHHSERARQATRRSGMPARAARPARWIRAARPRIRDV